ncbi:hypothetical protein BDR26DRAFT_798954, partial [Obelidium mucronatum]
GCGALFQRTSPGTPGFLPDPKSKQPPPSVHKLDSSIPIQHLDPDKELAQGLSPDQAKKVIRLERIKHKKMPICQYCHNLRHYNKTVIPHRPETKKILQKHLNEHPNTVGVLVVDAMDIPASIVSRGIPELAKTRGIVIALTKMDLLNQVKLNKEDGVVKMITYIKKHIQNDVDTSVVEVIPISSKTGDGVFELLDAVNKLRVEPTDHVSLIGRPNAGKSRLIQAIRALGNGENPKNAPTSSIYPGTTINVVSSPLSTFGLLFPNLAVATTSPAPSKTPCLYDTPGVFSESIAQLTTLLTPQELKFVVPQHPLPVRKAITLRTGTSVFVGGLVRIDFVAGTHEFRTRPKVFAFTNNALPIHQCRTNRSDGLLEKIDKHTDILFPPMGKKRLMELGGKLTLIKRIVWKDQKEWKRQGMFDVAIGGVGWVRMQGLPDDAIVEVWGLAEGCGVVCRESFFD